MQILIFRLCTLVLAFWNKTHVYNRDRLIRQVSKRPKGVPLVTVSNHYSCFDDPGLWGTLPIRLVCNTFSIRWSMAAHDICFTNRWHSMFFMFGKSFRLAFSEPALFSKFYFELNMHSIP